MWYPDTIEIWSLVTGGGQDENLNPIPEQYDFMPLSDCRIEKNGTAGTINGNDGKSYVYSYIVYMPKGLGVIPQKNDRVRITKADGTIDHAEFSVADFSSGLFNERLWI